MDYLTTELRTGITALEAAADGIAFWERRIADRGTALAAAVIDGGDALDAAVAYAAAVVARDTHRDDFDAALATLARHGYDDLAVRRTLACEGSRATAVGARRALQLCNARRPEPVTPAP